MNAWVRRGLILGVCAAALLGGLAAGGLAGWLSRPQPNAQVTSVSPATPTPNAAPATPTTNAAPVAQAQTTSASPVAQAPTATPVAQAANAASAAPKANTSPVAQAASASPVARVADASPVAHPLSAAPAGAGPTIGGCPVFPTNNVWNARIDRLPVHPRSDAWIASVGPSTGLHPDFGSGLDEGRVIGLPYTTVPGSQPEVSVSFEYEDESDPGPYRIPPDAPVEGGDDNHVLVVDRDACMLTELYAAEQESPRAWSAGSGAIFDLRSNRLRPASWTSADGAGLPILPGLVRYDEIAAGEIAHALRFTARRTQRAYVWPARHYASSIADPNVPPMGARVRLKASVDVSGYAPEVRVILMALQRYGMLLADNGSDWFVTGAPDPRWNNDTLRQLRRIVGNNLEFVDASPLMVDPDSGEVRAGAAP